MRLHLFLFSFKLMIIGIEPMISITANSTIKALVICCQLNAEKHTSLLFLQKIIYFYAFLQNFLKANE